MFRKALFLIGIPLFAALALSGCGGKSSGDPGNSGNSSNSSGAGPTSVSVTAALPAVDGLDTTTLSATVANDDHAEGVTWSLNGAGTLSKQTTTSVTYTAPAATSVTQSVTVTAVSVKEMTKYAEITLTVPPPPAIATASSALMGSVGASYSVQLAGSGGIPPYTWSVAAGGNLPVGLSLSAAGVISGIPLAASKGATNVFFQMQDSGTPAPLSTARTLSIAIAAAPAIAFTGAMPATGTYDLAYAGSASASGGAGALAYSVTSGALPAGLSLNPTTGAVTGTITATGNFSFTVQAADAFGDSAVQSYQILVNQPVLTVAPVVGSLPFALAGQPYAQKLTGAGGTGTGYSWTVSGLSDGFTYSANGAVLTINGPAASAGMVNFTAALTDSAGNSSGGLLYSIPVYGPVTLPSSNPATLSPAATTGTAYSGTVAASGGSGNYVWTVTGQSDGLTASPSGGTLTVSGSPTSPDTVSLGVSVKDTTTGLTAGPYTYIVTAYNPVTLPSSNPATLGPADASAPYTGVVAVSGGSGNFVWTVSGLPSDGLGSISKGGLLTIGGTPGTAATVTFTAKVTDTATNLSSGPYTYTVTVYNALNLPAPNPASLGPADAGSGYNGTISAAGGSGNYSWTVTGLSDGLSYSSSGAALAISGTPALAAAVSFNVTVTDTSTNITVGPNAYTITVYGGLVLPMPDPATLLSVGYTGVAYSGTINASGGSGNYSWVVTGLSDNLTSTSSGGALTIAGTPGTTPAAVTFDVTLKDTSTGFSVTQTGYNIAIGVPTPVTLPAANPASLPSATMSVPYPGSIVASGGVPPYTWSVNGVPIPNSGAAVSIADGISVSSNGSNTLSVGGTPAAIQTVNLTGVKITDSLGASQTNSYTIAVTDTSNVSGQISLNPTCGSGSQPVPPITVSLLSSPGGTLVQTVTTDSSGNFIFPGVLNGNYTISPTITGPSSVFYPATQSVTVNSADVTGESFNVALGYTVSGTVSYGGANTGQIYLSLAGSKNCGSGGLGTSIFAPGAFTIRGVPPGTYTLQAWMDISAMANGARNTSDPSGSMSVTVAAADVTGAAVTVTDNTPTSAPSANPALNAITPTDQGVTISFKAVTSNGVEAATSYDVQWSTSPDFSSSAGTYNFKAIGTGSNVWILNNGIAGIGGNPFINGETYYFEARARNAAGPASGWTVYGGATPAGVTVGESTSGNQVQGTVTIPGGITPTGPLYVGYFNQSTNAVYGTRIASPGTSNPFTVYVPTDTGNDYIFFEILDQNNDGLIDAGDVTNTNGNSLNATSISGSLTGQNLTLSTANSTDQVTTQYSQMTEQVGTTASSGYSLNFNVGEGNKLPVAVTLLSGPNVINPVDIGNYCQGCGSVQFQYHVPLNMVAPNVGDTYTLKITYSDSSSDTETLTKALTGWNGTTSIVGPDDLATNLSPTGQTSLKPTFTWTVPSADSTDFFSFYLFDAGGNTLWQVPGSSSNSNGFSSSITSIPYGVDPTNAGNDLPTGSGLTDSTKYSWELQILDGNGNEILQIESIEASGFL